MVETTPLIHGPEYLQVLMVAMAVLFYGIIPVGIVLGASKAMWDQYQKVKTLINNREPHQ